MNDSNDLPRRLDDEQTERSLKERANSSLQLTFDYGHRSAVIGMLTLCGVLFARAFELGELQMLLNIAVFTACGVAVMPIGIISGWFAHRIFYNSPISPHWMAVVFALIGDLTFLGWLIVAAQPVGY